MSFGLVPVVTDNGSMEYVIKSWINGIVVKKNSPQEIAGAIKSLTFKDGLMEELSRNAKKYVLENYNPDNYFKELNKIYDNA